jgi:hypothetical protein
MSYETRIKSVIVLPEGASMYNENATTVSIEDESCGEFVVVSQYIDDHQKIRIDREEWPAIRSAINKAVKNLKEEA